jgi:hypothetical protein
MSNVDIFYGQFNIAQSQKMAANVCPLADVWVFKAHLPELPPTSEGMPNVKNKS